MLFDEEFKMDVNGGLWNSEQQRTDTMKYPNLEELSDEKIGELIRKAIDDRDFYLLDKALDSRWSILCNYLSPETALNLCAKKPFSCDDFKAVKMMASVVCLELISRGIKSL